MPSARVLIDGPSGLVFDYAVPAGMPVVPGCRVTVPLRAKSAGGTVLSLDIKGGQPAAFRFLNALKIMTISNNLGDAKSIVTHPATTTHQRLSEESRAELGITPGLVRVSLGIEDCDDLIADVKQALDAI